VNKQRWLDAAQVFDTWRVVPRLVLFGYLGWIGHVTDSTLAWYMGLPMAAQTYQATGLAAAIITAVTGLFPWVYKIYSDAATDWSNQPARVTTTNTSTEVIK
jgi:hypothetical protein